MTNELEMIDRWDNATVMESRFGLASHRIRGKVKSEESSEFEPDETHMTSYGSKSKPTRNLQLATWNPGAKWIPTEEQASPSNWL